MTELEACAYAADLLKAIGFEHRWSSLKSEACYYGMPGRAEVVRIAAHRYGGAEYGLAPVIVCLTITPSIMARWGEVQIRNMTASAAGMYLLRASGAVRLSAKERARRDHRNRRSRSAAHDLVDHPLQRD